MIERKQEIEALLSINDRSLVNQRKILDELNSFLANCTQDLHDFGIKFEDAGLLEKLLFQIIFHNSSLSSLTNGLSINVRNKKIKVNDITAIYSLARLQIETFVNLSYIFFLDSKYSKSLRAYVYKIQGLRKQILLTIKHPKDFEPMAKMRNELAQEFSKIRKLEEFKESSFSDREKLINPKYARLIKQDDVYRSIKIGDLSRTHSLYSNHIHSEYISIRQLNSAIKKGEENESSFATVLFLCSRITSSVIANLHSQYQLNEGSYSKASIRMIKIVESLNKVSAQL